MSSDVDILNAREAAALLGAHVETLRRLARRGGIPSFKVGKDWRFRKEALLKWSEEQGLPTEKGASAGSGLVLIVDDEEHVCQALSWHLERIGCQTRQSTSGERALALVAQEAPDLILLDLHMPGMNGPAFLKRLRVTHPALPVVIVTGDPDGALMLEASRHGPLMLLAKPIDAEQLDRSVRMVLGAGQDAGRTS